MPDIISLLLLSMLFGSVFILAEIAYRIWKWPAELTRKIVHICGGVGSVFLPFLFSDYRYVLVLMIFFMGFLEITRIKGWQPSVHAIKRKSLGAVTFPAGVFISFIHFHFSSLALDLRLSFHFYIPLLIMAISDPLAVLGGTYYPIKRFNNGKSWGGTMFFFLSAGLICIICGSLTAVSIYNLLVISIVISFFTTITELYSKKGLDNLFIPISAILSMRILELIFHIL